MSANKTVRLTCDFCKRHTWPRVNSINTMLDTNGDARAFAQAFGWSMRGKLDICPECIVREGVTVDVSFPEGVTVTL